MSMQNQESEQLLVILSFCQYFARSLDIVSKFVKSYEIYHNVFDILLNLYDTKLFFI